MTSDDEHTADAGGPLSVHRAFVVQFRERPASDRSVFEGRVEHVASGAAATFTTCEALLAFLAAELPASPTNAAPASPPRPEKPR